MEKNSDKEKTCAALENKYLRSQYTSIIFDESETFTSTIKEVKDKLLKGDVDFVRAFMPTYGVLFGRVDTFDPCIEDVRYKVYKNGDIKLDIVFNGQIYLYNYNDLDTTKSICKLFIDTCGLPLMDKLVNDIKNNPDDYYTTSYEKFNPINTICLYNMLIWNIADETEFEDFITSIDMKEQLYRYEYETRFIYEDELVYFVKKEESKTTEDKVYVVISEMTGQAMQILGVTHNKITAYKILKADLKDALEDVDSIFHKDNNSTGIIRSVGLESFMFSDHYSDRFEHTYIVEENLV